MLRYGFGAPAGGVLGPSRSAVMYESSEADPMVAAMNVAGVPASIALRSKA